MSWGWWVLFSAFLHKFASHFSGNRSSAVHCSVLNPLFCSDLYCTVLHFPALISESCETWIESFAYTSIGMGKGHLHLHYLFLFSSVSVSVLSLLSILLF
jgi:hypothetical protein